MRPRMVTLTGTAAAAAVIAMVSVAGQAPPPSAPANRALETSWGEPDLQGVWADQQTTPFQRPAKYAGREFLTAEEIAELDKERAADRFSSVQASGDLLLRPLGLEGREVDVAKGDDAALVSTQRTGRRTSLIVDPPDGRVPPLTPEAQQSRAAMRQFQLALLQATDACKNGTPVCAGGTYGPPSPRRREPPPDYNSDRLNRADGPEDRSLGERCMAGGLPDFAGFRQIVQSPGSVSIFYDTGQGQGWHRSIPIISSPHLPDDVRLWWGDSRGRWEGTTLVVDVTNFSRRTDYRGSRDRLHLIERWTRTSPHSIEYTVTIEDPATWTKPWTVKQELSKESDQENRIYKEPRCHEGNFGMIGILSNMRSEERAFAEGRGPDPATKDNASNQGLGEEADQASGR